MWSRIRSGLKSPAEDIGGGDAAIRAGLRIIDPDAAGGVGRDGQLADPQRGQPGVLAKALFAVGAGGARDIGARAGDHAQRLGDQREHRLAVELHDQRHAADDLVPIDMLVEEAVADGGGLERRQVGDRGGKGVDEMQRVVAGERIPGLLQRLWAFGVVDQDEAATVGSDSSSRPARRRGRAGSQQPRGVLTRVALLRELSEQQLGRGAVRLGEDDVERRQPPRRHRAACRSAGRRGCAARAIGRIGGGSPRRYRQC